MLWKQTVLAVTFFALSCSTEAPDPKRPPPPQGKASTAAEDRSIAGKAPLATGPYPSVIILEPRDPERSPLPAKSEVMDQYGTAFHPSVLLVRAGQAVEFRNSEDQAHNVHVVETATGSSVLNVETPVFGAYPYAFERTGIYRISCDIHPAMRAFIVVTSSPYAVVADREGNFSIPEVPPGSYRLTVWNTDAARRMERTVEIEGPETELVLDHGH